MVYHLSQAMAKEKFQQAIYVRKKYKGKRKWIRIGTIRRDLSIDLDRSDTQLKALISNDEGAYNWFRKELDKIFQE